MKNKIFKGTTMTIFTLDVSNHDYDRGSINWQSVRGAGIEVAIAKATEGDPAGYHYTDPWYVRAVTDARTASVGLMGGYHCLAAGDQNSINRQVDWLVSRANETGGVTKGWWMLDIEPFTELSSRGMAPRLQDVLAFEARWNDVTGGYPITHYLPHWYWQQWGSPALTALRGPLVSSNYPVTATMAFDQLYARDGGDNGPGWAAYGGKTPTLWQYASSDAVPGVVGNCDANAFKGTYDQLVPILTGPGVVLVSTPPTPIPSGDPIMSALPLLQQGSISPSVKNLQALLNVHGYGLAVDGQFGPLTKGATVKFQTANHLGVDGIVGQHTWSMLLLGHDL